MNPTLEHPQIVCCSSQTRRLLILVAMNALLYGDEQTTRAYRLHVLLGRRTEKRVVGSARPEFEIERRGKNA